MSNDHAAYAHPTGGVDETYSTYSKRLHETLYHHGRSPLEHQNDKTTPDNWQSQYGQDILCPVGTPIYAVADGKIPTNEKLFGSQHSKLTQHEGLRVYLYTENNQFFYEHLSRFADGISPGAEIHRGQLIGYSGIGGNIPHLHFSVQDGSTLEVLLHSDNLHDGPPPDVVNTVDSSAGAFHAEASSTSHQLTAFNPNFTSPDGTEINVPIGMNSQAPDAQSANFSSSEGKSFHANADGTFSPAVAISSPLQESSTPNFSPTDGSGVFPNPDGTAVAKSPNDAITHNPHVNAATSGSTEGTAIHHSPDGTLSGTASTKELPQDKDVLVQTHAQQTPPETTVLQPDVNNHHDHSEADGMN